MGQCPEGARAIHPGPKAKGGTRQQDKTCHRVSGRKRCQLWKRPVQRHDDGAGPSSGYKKRAEPGRFAVDNQGAGGHNGADRSAPYGVAHKEGTSQRDENENPGHQKFRALPPWTAVNAAQRRVGSKFKGCCQIA